MRLQTSGPNGYGVLAKSSIPFIGLSSGSVAANGAISGITALPIAYPKAYCWFPANALATVKAAGWYYCTFSTTTAGVAYLDTYTSGVPAVPASPTAVTDGKGSFTGDTGEEFGPAITVPGNVLGPNGQLRLTMLHAASPSNANGKTVRNRFSGNGGAIGFSGGMGGSIKGFSLSHWANRNAPNAQVSGGFLIGNNGSPTASIGAEGAVDTTAASTLVISLQRATATDNLVLDSFLVELLSDGT